MADHQHNSWDVYDVATSGDLRNAVSLTEGVRHDLGMAEERIRELETQVGQLLRDVAELREQAGEIDDLKERVQTLVSVLASHLADAGQPIAAESVAEAARP